MSGLQNMKKRKSDDAPSSWRIKCIEQFNLQPVPTGWKDTVTVGTESAWKRYFEYRSREEEKSLIQANSGDEDYDYEGLSTLLKKWKQEMSWTEYSDEWFSWTPRVGDLSLFEEYDELRTGEYFSHIWSPYAIPHALGLVHYYHRRTRWSSIEFNTNWSYRMIGFEADSSTTSEYKELCSNCYEDEELRADVIDTSNLNINTVNKLRRFLFGSDSEDSKKLICPDDRFLRILFGSMGTVDPDLESDMLQGNLGYVWKVGYNDDQLRRTLFEAKAPEDDDPDGDPPESFDEYYPCGCSWLRYRVLKITGTLGPVSKYYKPPTIKDAAGYREDSDEDSDEEEDEYKGVFEAVRKNISDPQLRTAFERFA